MSAEGNGRSMCVAKHQAAASVIKKLHSARSDISEIQQMCDSDEMPTTDVLVVLRDYCMQHHYPLPTFEIVKQAGTLDAPEFTAVCTIASLQRSVVSAKKKDARQLVALEMLRVIIDDDKMKHHMQEETLAAQNAYIEAQQYRVFRT